MRTPRSENAIARSDLHANETQARAVVQTIAADMARQSEREDWRAKLARRDSGRTLAHAEREAAANLRRQSRRSHVRNVGRVTLPTLATLGTLAAAVGGAVVRVFGALVS